MPHRSRGRVRLDLAVRLTVRWSQIGDRYYGGELEEMLGFVAYGASLADVVGQIRAQVLQTSAADWLEAKSA